MTKEASEIKSLLARVPKAKLGFFPTPLHRLDRLSKELSVELYIKRDDLSGRSLFGGNKIRKLEYLIGAAKESGCDYVITYGATQSNHAMQTVTACCLAGLKPILYLVAIVDLEEEDIRSNLLLDQIMGAEIHIVRLLQGETEAAAEERSFRMGEQRCRELEAQGHKAYNIPMGGANAVGSLAFMEGFLEMTEQMEAMGMKADYLFHGTGTGGTYAGLAAGARAIGSGTKIISVQVSEKTFHYTREIAAIANGCFDLLEVPLKLSAGDLFTDPNYFSPGYERPNAFGNGAIRELAGKEGIFVDPVYTGKAFAGMLDYIRSGRVLKGSAVVFWHTGGATALFAEKEIIGDLAASLH